MNLGVGILHSLTASRVGAARLAKAAESAGYHSLWVSEHIAMPVHIESKYPFSSDGLPPFGHDEEWAEAMVALGFLAGVTQRVRLGTSVIAITNRDPISLAKQAATVDRLSDGRLELGLGAGWCREEAQLLGHSPDDAAARLDETIDIMHKAWRGSSFEHRGRFWDIPAVGVHPQPVQDEVPIWIGGTSPALLRTTVEKASGNLVPKARPDRVRDIRARLPPPTQVGTALRLTDDIGNALADEVLALRDAGVDLLVLHPGEHQDKAVARIELFAEAIVPQLS